MCFSELWSLPIQPSLAKGACCSWYLHSLARIVGASGSFSILGYEKMF